MKHIFKKLGIPALILSSVFASACGPRQKATEVGIETTGWGKQVSISTDSGLKCFLPGCRPGVDWLFLSTGEHALHIYAINPESVPSAADQQKNESASYGVVKTVEGLPLQGNVTIWVQFQDVKGREADIENLYRTFPPHDMTSDEYQEKIMTRLAQHALDSVQQAYRTINIQEVTTKTNGKGGIEEDIKEKVAETFKEAGFGVVAVKSVVLAGINLGKEAEAANEQIGLAQVQMAVADKQVLAATKLKQAQDVLAPITVGLITQFKAAGVDSDALPEMVCLHEKINNEDFSQRHPQGCFPSMNLPSTNTPGGK